MRHCAAGAKRVFFNSIWTLPTNPLKIEYLYLQNLLRILMYFSQKSPRKTLPSSTRFWGRLVSGEDVTFAEQERVQFEEGIFPYSKVQPIRYKGTIPESIQIFEIQSPTGSPSNSTLSSEHNSTSGSSEIQKERNWITNTNANYVTRFKSIFWVYLVKVENEWEN